MGGRQNADEASSTRPPTAGAARRRQLYNATHAVP
jgi:hypothetical protein